MNLFEEDLLERLNSIRQKGLYRELRRIDSPQAPRLRIDGEWLLNFSSNDYLGLANEPLTKEAAIRAIDKYGAGSGASRLITGSLAPHLELEEALAEFKGTEAALTFSSGYSASVGTICALLDKEDVIIIDKVVHASIVDAARLCRAKLRVFAHNDVDDLEAILRWADQRRRTDSLSGNWHSQSRTRILIVTESVFSMDGDCAPLPEIVELKDTYGAWLMLDEAHASGLYGLRGAGLAAERGLQDRIEVQMGTLGKALGASGGFVCGSRVLIDYLINQARTFIFSTAPVPAAAGAAQAGIKFVQSAAGVTRRDLLWQRVAQVQEGLAPRAKPLGSRPEGFSSAILPIVIGDESKAVEIAASLRSHGIYIPAIRFPTVSRGQARLRLTVTAAHTESDVEQLIQASTLLQAAERASPGISNPL